MSRKALKSRVRKQLRALEKPKRETQKSRGSQAAFKIAFEQRKRGLNNTKLSDEHPSLLQLQNYRKTKKKSAIGKNIKKSK